MSTITAFDITVRNWGKNLRSWRDGHETRRRLGLSDLSWQSKCFDVHAYAAFILELSYVATNNLPQLNSFKSYSTPSFSKQRLFISRMPDFWFHYLLGITDRKSSSCWNIVCSRLLTCTQSVSTLRHLLSISAGFLTRIIGAAQLPTISSSTILSFSQACNSFQDGGGKHDCDEHMVLAGCSCVFVWAF